MWSCSCIFQPIIMAGWSVRANTISILGRIYWQYAWWKLTAAARLLSSSNSYTLSKHWIWSYNPFTKNWLEWSRVPNHWSAPTWTSFSNISACSKRFGWLWPSRNTRMQWQKHWGLKHSSVWFALLPATLFTKILPILSLRSSPTLQAVWEDASCLPNLKSSTR